MSRVQMGSVIYNWGVFYEIENLLSPTASNNLLKQCVAIKGDLVFPIEDDCVVYKNGVHILYSNHLVGTTHDPKYFVRHILPFDYDPTGKCPNFDKFLNFSFNGDKELINFIRAYNWAILHGYTQAQVFLYLLGRGGTGK
jgi:phage/plasmid-associated DNA primase